MSKIIVSAYNVHCGGGLVLLESLLAGITSETRLLLFDTRLNVSQDLINGAEVQKFRPTLRDRFRAELFLRKAINSGDATLCFGNTPPLFKNKGKTILFLQNALLITQGGLAGFPLRVRVRITFERLLLRLKSSNVDTVVVQTPTMRRLAEKLFGNKIPVSVATLSPVFSVQPRKQNSTSRDNFFFYPASGDPHKNHLRLLEAWCLLAKEEIYPELILTVSTQTYAKLSETIQQLTAQNRLKIKNLDNLDRKSVLDLIQRSNALIFPSFCESFGLPLVEANHLHTPIISSELDYVRDVCVPAETFDPHSAHSIAFAVKRYLGTPQTTCELLVGKEFIERLK